MTTNKKSIAAKKTAQASNQFTKTATQAAQKTADTAKETVKSHISALESNAVTTDQMVHAGTEAVKDFLAAGTEEAQKTQEKVLSFSKENLEKWTESTDKTVRTFAEAFAVNKEQVDALLESSKLAGELSRELHEEFLAEINTFFAENVELSKELLACRTLNDVVEVQNRAVQQHLALFFNNSARLTETWFKLATEVAEPISTQASQATARLNKTLAA